MLEFGNLQMPYLDSSEAPDIGGQALAQAQRLELISGAGVALVADATARAALVTNGDAFDGLLVMQLSDHSLWVRSGVTWVCQASDWIAWATAATNITLGVGGTLSQRYKYIAGGLIYVKIKVVLGSSGFAVGTGPYFTLPFSIVQDVPGFGSLNGRGNAYDVSAPATQRLQPGLDSTFANRVRPLYDPGNAVPAQLAAAVPFASWGAGDIIELEFMAEV